MHSIWMTSCRPTSRRMPLKPSRFSHETSSLSMLKTPLPPSSEMGFSMKSSAPLTRQAARLLSEALPVRMAMRIPG